MRLMGHKYILLHRKVQKGNQQGIELTSLYLLALSFLVTKLVSLDSFLHRTKNMVVSATFEARLITRPVLARIDAE